MFPERIIAEIVLPEQIVCDEFVAIAFGFGYTKTVAVIGVPLQLLATGVIIKVTVIVAFVVFIRLPLMSLFPLEPIPVTVAVLFLVQL